MQWLCVAVSVSIVQPTSGRQLAMAALAILRALLLKAVCAQCGLWSRNSFLNVSPIACTAPPTALRAFLTGTTV